MTGRQYEFGSFRLLPERQLLLQEGVPVRIGGRALDILIALIERAGELLSKDELIARVWPNLVVDEGNLRAQVAILRRALGGGRGGERFVVSIAGRGYRFVAPVSTLASSAPVLAAPLSSPHRVHRVPKPISRVIGRGDVVVALSKRLERRRFISIVAPGGIGKTTVALTLANDTSASFEHGVYFVDLAPMSSSLAISSVLASALGLAVVSDDPISELTAFLRERKLLLIFDSCEHVLEAAGLLAESVLREAPDVRIIATSREPLRAEGESIYHLAPLETPPETAPRLTAAIASTFSAVELFVERAMSIDDEFEFDDDSASIVADICRKLDGMALAIELAAARVDTFGLRGLAAQLDDRFRLLMQGRRTALPRHRTLGAALDWSYQFLEPAEQAVLRRLSVFVGGFALDAAHAVANESGLSDIIGIVAGLVEKSLISVNRKVEPPTYRLLDTTRAYASEKLIASGEFSLAAARHAEYYRRVLIRAGSEAETVPLEVWLATYGRQVDNVRKALDWTFSPEGDPSLAVILTQSALPLWMHLSLMNECRSRVEQALALLLSRSERDTRLELQFNHALGAVLLNIEATGPEIDVALADALALAETLGDTDYKLRVLWCLWCHAHNRGAFREAMSLADQFSGVATQSSDAVDLLTGERMRGFTLHFYGDQGRARERIEYMLKQYVAPAHRSHIIRFQFDQKITARNFRRLSLGRR